MTWRVTLFALFGAISLGCARSPLPGALCADPSQCATPLTCHFGVCRAPCTTNAECGTSEICVSPASGGGCVRAAELPDAGPAVDSGPDDDAGNDAAH